MLSPISNEFTPGMFVYYHGSLPEAHGVYQAWPCPCCHTPRMGSFRYLLTDRDGSVKVQCVRASSVSANCPLPASMAADFTEAWGKLDLIPFLEHRLSHKETERLAAVLKALGARVAAKEWIRRRDARIRMEREADESRVTQAADEAETAVTRHAG